MKQEVGRWYLFSCLFSISIFLSVCVGEEADIRNLYNQGLGYFNERKYEEASFIWASMLEKVPYLEVLWTNLGTTFRMMGNNEKAEETYLLAIATLESKKEDRTKDITMNGVLWGLCDVRYSIFVDKTWMMKSSEERLEAVNLCEGSCKKALAADPSSVEVLTTLGALYTETFQFSLAVEYYEKAIQLDPSNVKLHRNIAITYSRLGLYAEAIKFTSHMLEKLNVERAGRLPEQCQVDGKCGDFYNQDIKDKLSEKELWSSPMITDLLYTDGLIRSLKSDRDPLSGASYLSALIRQASEQQSISCDQGFGVVLGWWQWVYSQESRDEAYELVRGSSWVPDRVVKTIENLSQDVEVSLVEKANPITLGKIHLYSADLHSDNGIREFVDKTVVLVKLKDILLEGRTGIFYHDIPHCVVYSGGHTVVSKVNDEFLATNAEIEYITTPIASILQQNPGNYYHFMAEVCVRFVLLEKHVLKLQENRKMKVLVPTLAKKLVEEVIVGLLGFDEKRLLWYDSSKGTLKRLRYEISEVTLIDWVNPERKGMAISPYDTETNYYPPQIGLQMMREKLVGWKSDYISTTDERHPNVVFISREDAVVRKMPKEDEEKIVEVIKRIFLPANVLFFSAKGSPISEQISLFKKADIIVGSHGAGLTNMMWTPPGSSVIVFPISPPSDNCFGYLSSALGLDFWIIESYTAGYYDQYKTISHATLAELEKIFKTIASRRNFIMNY